MKTIPKSPHGSLEWLHTRWRDAEGRTVFGASDIPALMGASTYTSRAKLFANKCLSPVVQPETAVFRRGNILEAPLLKEAAYILGRNIFTPDVVYRKGRLSISLDGVDNEKSPTITVEAKSTTRYSIYDQTDLPDEWCWQGWAQQSVLGVPVWFIVLDRDQRISCVPLPDNPAAIELLTAEADKFGGWIDEGTPPLDEINDYTAEDIANIWKVTPTEIELPVGAVDWLIALDDARQQSKQASELESAAKDAIAQMLLGNEVGLLNGVKAVSWKQQAGKPSLDMVRLKTDHSELLTEYEKTGHPFRVMRTHRKKA